MIAGDDIHGSVLGGFWWESGRGSSSAEAFMSMVLVMSGSHSVGGKGRHKSGKKVREKTLVWCRLSLRTMPYWTTYISDVPHCEQTGDQLSNAAKRSTGVNRMRMARAVASLWQVIALCVHGCWASMQLDPDAKDGGNLDDDGVSMAMKNNVLAFTVSPT